MKKCNATIAFGDDLGENSSTFHCQLEKGHNGQHKEIGNMGYGGKDIPYTLEWFGDRGEE
jgi:hypothetical protein